jgi:hypothetical protein
MARKLSPKGWPPVNFDVLCLPSTTIVFCKLPTEQSNVHITNLSSISVIGALSHDPILVSAAVYFYKRRKGGTCTMIQVLMIPVALALPLAMSVLSGSSLFACFGSSPYLHLALQSCVSAWYKSSW